MKNADLEAIRRKNLDGLVEKRYGAIADFCRDTDLDVTVISSLRGGKRSFTEHYAREIEAAKKWPRGYLDMEHPTDASPGSLEYVESAVTAAGFMNDDDKAYVLGLIKAIGARKP